MRISVPACIVILLSLCGCRPRQAAFVPVDPALAVLVPPDTVALGGMRMEALRNTSTYRKLATGLLDQRFEEFSRTAGFDLRKDVRELLVAMDGNRILTLARGRFSAAALERALGNGVVKTFYKGHTLIGSGPVTLTLFDSSTVVAGHTATVKMLIDRGRGQGIPSSLRNLMQSVPPESQAWGVMVGTPMGLENHIPKTGDLASIRKVLALLASSAIGVDLHAGCMVKANFICRTLQDAKLLHDGLRGLIGLGRLSAPEDRPDLLRLYDGMEVQQHKEVVQVEASISEEVLDSVLKHCVLNQKRGNGRF